MFAWCHMALLGRAETIAELVLIAFPNEAKAEEVRQKLLAMQTNEAALQEALAGIQAVTPAR
jgi:uncharacterized membrane protein